VDCFSAACRSRSKKSSLSTRQVVTCIDSIVVMFECMIAIIKSLFIQIRGIFLCKVLHFDELSVAINENELLGEGAYSMVYKGRKRYDQSTKYAVKKIYVQSSEFSSIAQAEIEAFKRFQHPNILKMVAHMQQSEGSSSVIYILLPYIKKGSVRNILQQVADSKLERAPLKHILQDFVDICSAFNVLHSSHPSYVHQDIKPENILIADNGTPLLTDFGSVRKADIHVETRNQQLTVAEDAAQYCTASYRAPELFDPPKGIRLDTRTDVWGMGCLLFAWWVGYSPFECEFYGSRLVVVECTSLRVLSPIPQIPFPNQDDMRIAGLVGWMVKQEMASRPFTSDIIARVHQAIADLEKGARIPADNAV
jgi:serine/threonine kinase 16